MFTQAFLLNQKPISLMQRIHIVRRVNYTFYPKQSPGSTFIHHIWDSAEKKGICESRHEQHKAVLLTFPNFKGKSHLLLQLYYNTQDLL